LTWQTISYVVCFRPLDHGTERAQGKGSGTVLKMGLPPNPVPAYLRLRRPVNVVLIVYIIVYISL